MEAAAYIERVKDTGLLPVAEGVGIDPIGVAALVDELEARGIAPGQQVAIRQGFALSPASWGSEIKLKNGSLKHSGQPMMAWCVGNAKVEVRGGAVIITKQSAGRAKIDPLVAAFNAMMLMSRKPIPPVPTVIVRTPSRSSADHRARLSPPAPPPPPPRRDAPAGPANPAAPPPPPPTQVASTQRAQIGRA
ncbi:terminase TerL endonuclease subunit [Brevundimonas sp. KM4]|uniref:terminase TerL endonuclease subunit n=1 Tax=Brevundimonas sp. KM4 TaxID=1628191 RepID=UPI0035108BB4